MGEVRTSGLRRGGLRRGGLKQGLYLSTLLLFFMVAAFPYTLAAQDRTRLLVLGDSLTAGYGLPREEAFPVKLEAWLKQAGLDVQVINAGVSGDTTAGGLARLDWALGTPLPHYAVVALGSNDGLRGLPPAAMEQNLDAIVSRLKQRGIKVLLAGMYAPRNFGREYAAEYDAVFQRVAKRHETAFYPFFLEGVAGDPALNQGDGIHPNPRGVARMVEGIGPHIRRLLAGS